MSMLLAVSLACVAVAPIRQAQDPTPRLSYVQLNAGLAFDDFDLDEVEDAIGTDVDVDESLVISARVGRRLSDNVAGEIVFDWLDQFDLEAFGSEFGELSAWSIAGNMKLYPHARDVEPYLQFGLGVLSGEFEDTVGAGVSEEESDLFLRGGAGLDVAVGSNLFVNLDAVYTLATGDLDEFDFLAVTAGVGIRL
jgi:opacity protein-like surface antigen